MLLQKLLNKLTTTHYILGISDHENPDLEELLEVDYEDSENQKADEDLIIGEKTRAFIADNEEDLQVE